MTDTNIIDRTPTKFDYASPIQFRFKMTKIPNVEFFVQTANIPGITLDEVQQPDNDFKSNSLYQGLHYLLLV